jgi:hypothetical protein
MRNSAVYQFALALPGIIRDAGFITDELTRIPDASTSLLDERLLSEDGATGADSYAALHSVRKYASQAIGALATYDTVAADTTRVRVWRGELYALTGYADIILADLFCSGVPLSTFDFEHDYTVHASSTTAQVYQAAIAKFDTALVLAQGNDTIMNLARVGRGRAWLDLGQYDSAGAAVQGVPNGFKYQLIGVWNGGDNHHILYNAYATVSDREGINGLPYIASRDPRSQVMPVSWGVTTVNFPSKYQASLSGNTSGAIVVADGIEAQLIRAEAALQAGDMDTWLTTLNALRTSGVADSVVWADTVGVTVGVYGDSGRLVSRRVDTVYDGTQTSITNIYTIDTYQRPVWRAGTGGISGLYPIHDPDTAAARVDTLFTERAEWLFLTGHRQGDLRRLLRKYGPLYPSMSDQARVYPSGMYGASGQTIYGSDVTLPIPSAEYANPLFHGCLNREP